MCVDIQIKENLCEVWEMSTEITKKVTRKSAGKYRIVKAIQINLLSVASIYNNNCTVQDVSICGFLSMSLYNQGYSGQHNSLCSWTFVYVKDSFAAWTN